MVAPGDAAAARRRGPWLWKGAVSVGLLGLVVWQVGLGDLVRSIAAVDPRILGVAFALSGAFILGRAAKWMLLLRAHLPASGYRESLVSLVGGMALGMVTPGRLGELSRLYFLGGDRVQLAGLFMVDRALDLLSIAVFGSLSAALLRWPRASLAAFAFLGLGATALLGAWWLAPRLDGWSGDTAWRRTLQRALRGLGQMGAARLLVMFAVSLAASAVGYLQFYVLLRGFGDVGVLPAVLCLSGMILSNLLPITVAGLGLREAVAGVILVRFGFHADAAVSASLLAFIGNTLLPGVVGAWIFARAEPPSRDPLETS